MSPVRIGEKLRSEFLLGTSEGLELGEGATAPPKSGTSGVWALHLNWTIRGIRMNTVNVTQRGMIVILTKDLPLRSRHAQSTVRTSIFGSFERFVRTDLREDRANAASTSESSKPPDYEIDGQMILAETLRYSSNSCHAGLKTNRQDLRNSVPLVLNYKAISSNANAVKVSFEQAND